MNPDFQAIWQLQRVDEALVNAVLRHFGVTEPSTVQRAAALTIARSLEDFPVEELGSLGTRH